MLEKVSKISESKTGTLEDYFEVFRRNIIGIEQTFESPQCGTLPITYADWTASGRLYGPLEKQMQTMVYPFVANTHTETSTTGMAMTRAYHEALHRIKGHVNARTDDIIISSNSGMTGVLNKFQRILGLKVHEKFKALYKPATNERPVVFITHMEHHSNHTTWLETICDVEIIAPDNRGLVNLRSLKLLLEKYAARKLKIASVTACSNVTGISTPYYAIAKLMHDAGGYCFVDFACSAPYVNIDMHPKGENQYLDAIFFSPHKFLGGPGSSGILIFNKELYDNKVPDNPGGGTVDWTNPWGGHKYLDDIEAREDGGTPGFLQTIRVALSIKLKEKMGVEKMRAREEEQLGILWSKLIGIPNLHILAENVRERLAIISFYIDDLHYNMGVKILNDRFGIQVRGGCSCAGTYGHFLLHVDIDHSRKITDLINQGDYSQKPGWIRLSVHPTMTNCEVEYIADSIVALAENHKIWSADYELDRIHNRVRNKEKCHEDYVNQLVDEWLEL